MNLAMNFATNLATHVRPISYLKTHTAEVVKHVAEGDPMLITQHGQARLVVMDASAYEEREQTLALLKMLAMGNRDIEEGRMYDAESVFAEFDAMDDDILDEASHV